MLVDPRYGVWISIAAALINFLISADALSSFNQLFGAETSTKVIAIIALVGGLVNVVNAVLHSMPAGSFEDPNIARKFAFGPKQ